MSAVPALMSPDPLNFPLTPSQGDGGGGVSVGCWSRFWNGADGDAADDGSNSFRWPASTVSSFASKGVRRTAGLADTFPGQHPEDTESDSDDDERPALVAAFRWLHSILEVWRSRMRVRLMPDGSSPTIMVEGQAYSLRTHLRTYKPRRSALRTSGVPHSMSSPGCLEYDTSTYLPASPHSLKTLAAPPRPVGTSKKKLRFAIGVQESGGDGDGSGGCSAGGGNLERDAGAVGSIPDDGVSERQTEIDDGGDGSCAGAGRGRREVNQVPYSDGRTGDLNGRAALADAVADGRAATEGEESYPLELPVQASPQSACHLNAGTVARTTTSTTAASASMSAERASMLACASDKIPAIAAGGSELCSNGVSSGSGDGGVGSRIQSAGVVTDANAVVSSGVSVSYTKSPPTSRPGSSGQSPAGSQGLRQASKKLLLQLGVQGTIRIHPESDTPTSLQASAALVAFAERQVQAPDADAVVPLLQASAWSPPPSPANAPEQPQVSADGGSSYTDAATAAGVAVRPPNLLARLLMGTRDPGVSTSSTSATAAATAAAAGFHVNSRSCTTSGTASVASGSSAFTVRCGVPVAVTGTTATPCPPPAAAAPSLPPGRYPSAQVLRNTAFEPGRPLGISGPLAATKGSGGGGGCDGGDDGFAQRVSRSMSYTSPGMATGSKSYNQPQRATRHGDGGGGGGGGGRLGVAAADAVELLAAFVPLGQPRRQFLEAQRPPSDGHRGRQTPPPPPPMTTTMMTTQQQKQKQWRRKLRLKLQPGDDDQLAAVSSATAAEDDNDNDHDEEEEKEEEEVKPEWRNERDEKRQAQDQLGHAHGDADGEREGKSLVVDSEPQWWITSVRPVGDDVGDDVSDDDAEAAAAAGVSFNWLEALRKSRNVTDRCTKMAGRNGRQPGGGNDVDGAGELLWRLGRGNNPTVQQSVPAPPRLPLAPAQRTRGGVRRGNSHCAVEMSLAVQRAVQAAQDSTATTNRQQQLLKLASDRSDEMARAAERSRLIRAAPFTAAMNLLNRAAFAPEPAMTTAAPPAAAAVTRVSPSANSHIAPNYWRPQQHKQQQQPSTESCETGGPLQGSLASATVTSASVTAATASASSPNAAERTPFPSGSGSGSSSALPRSPARSPPLWESVYGLSSSADLAVAAAGAADRAATAAQTASAAAPAAAAAAVAFPVQSKRSTGGDGAAFGGGGLTASSGLPPTSAALLAEWEESEGAPFGVTASGGGAATAVRPTDLLPSPSLSRSTLSGSNSDLHVRSRSQIRSGVASWGPAQRTPGPELLALSPLNTPSANGPWVEERCALASSGIPFADMTANLAQTLAARLNMTSSGVTSGPSGRAGVSCHPSLPISIEIYPAAILHCCPLSEIMPPPAHGTDPRVRNVSARWDTSSVRHITMYGRAMGRSSRVLCLSAY
ncbi:hypothetical protein VOLCADRAFT_98097 [Volvox carteri f. nagariensis]|uniref:Uncharacterized protein n=1 Tax=Volvox carteri f. nagariensis TaxID=3068 RepID=D8UEF7_VOLCA|nr:uncharacterized protein VOLCADRAFT_98097 [Volvox carteri f. nagariensis]EFJ41836.1 hypothetical protein VOLCADRAFT_98097 [Volvox carteri f. nagariensis]|eukprot:XP_002957034.1 hypothetical protein VOLCADRAFT_98097 [Volvox carteri f. nagariensis]